MADDGSAQIPAQWALPKFHYEVNWGDAVMTFQEVSGLDSKTDPIEYRTGNNPAFSLAKKPDGQKTANITLKRGLFNSDTKFWDWQNRQLHTHPIDREPVKIRLMDENGAAMMVWTLTNAWPVKVSGTNLEAAGKEVAIETIEIACDGLSIAGD